jgi:hypothetical protein
LPQKAPWSKKISEYSERREKAGIAEQGFSKTRCVPKRHYREREFMIKIAITLSVQKINAGRRYGERFDPRDYARKLARHLEPNLGDVVVEAIEGRPDHDVEIFLPARAVACTEALELIGNRVREALQRFHDGAPAIVERAQPARLRKPVLRELRIAS